ncbi:MAG: hypothetical protein WBE72_11975 [Terracidiphilus sp.]
MQTPQFLLDLLQVLLDLAVPAAFCTLAAAGVSLRHEGGINFHVNGRSGKWILWTVVLLTLPQLLSWVPDRFLSEMAAIGQLHDPERTEALEALNDRILADMTQFLLAAARPEVSERVEIATPVSSCEPIDQLAAYLTKENPYYALWIRYTSPVSEPNSELGWEEFVAQELGGGTNEEIEFALLVGQLGKLLTYFRHRNLALPPHFSGRVWFLHYLPGAERNAHARALVQELAEATGSCTYA